MVGQFEAWLDIAEMGERSGVDPWVGGLIAAGIGLASGVMALCLVAAVQRLKRRLSNLETRHAEHVERLRGPSVREYCRSLIEALALRVPRARQHRPSSEAESDLIESMRLHARSYRNMARKLSGPDAEPMNERAFGSLHLQEVEQPLDAGEPTPNEERTMNDESVDTILAEAEQAAITEADDTHEAADGIGDPPTNANEQQTGDAHNAAAAPEVEHQQAAEEVFASMPETEPPGDADKAADSIGGPPTNANEQPSPDASALQELCVRAESLGRVLSELTERLATERASAEQLLTRVDQRIEALQAASQAGEAAPGPSDVTADAPAEAPSIADVPATAPAPSSGPASVPGGSTDHNSPAGELEVLNASLIEHLAQRKQLLNQMDGAFRDRQMNLAAEILQAETGQVELGDALEKIEAAVSTIQALAHEAATTHSGAV